MYKNMLPNTSGLELTLGASGSGIAAMTGHQTIALGVVIVVIGLVVFKALRFKIKDSK